MHYFTLITIFITNSSQTLRSTLCQLTTANMLHQEAESKPADTTVLSYTCCTLQPRASTLLARQHNLFLHLCVVLHFCIGHMTNEAGFSHTDANRRQSYHFFLPDEGWGGETKEGSGWILPSFWPLIRLIRCLCHLLKERAKVSCEYESGCYVHYVSSVLKMSPRSLQCVK